MMLMRPSVRTRRRDGVGGFPIARTQLPPPRADTFSMAKRPNQAVPVNAAFRRLLPLTVALTAAATVLATVERLAGPVWMPAAAAIAGALVNAAWLLTIGRRFERVVMIEPLPPD